MAKIEPVIVPDEYYSARDKAALVKRIQAREVLRIEDATAELGISIRKLDDLCAKHGLPHHRIPGMAGKIFLRSELIEYVRRH